MVANPERGEVSLRVFRGDDEREYILKLSMNAAVAMQKKLGKSLAAAVADMEKLDMETIRHMAFMFLQKYHKDEITSVELAGDLIDDAGGVGKFMGAFQQLVTANNPTEGGTENPPTAQTKTKARITRITTDASMSSPDATA